MKPEQMFELKAGHQLPSSRVNTRLQRTSSMAHARRGMGKGLRLREGRTNEMVEGGGKKDGRVLKAAHRT